MMFPRKQVQTIILSSLLLAAFPSHADTAVDEQYEAALALAREGQFTPALEILGTLSAQHPETLRLLYDYLAVLGWAERDAEVLALANRIDLASAPPYVLETIGKSARNTRSYGLAINAYSLARDQDPLRLENTLGLAMALSDGGKPDEALTLLAEFPATGEQELPILLTRGYILKAKPNTFFDLLAVYNRVLEIDPDNEEGWQGKILTTQWLGAPHLAARMLAEHPTALSPSERASLMADRAATRIGWGGMPATPSAEQRTLTETAMSEIRATLSDLETQGQDETPAGRRAHLDLLVALHNLGSHGQAVEQYKWLATHRADLPAYALVAAADSYLQLQQPAAAIPVFQEALKLAPTLPAAQSGLFFALADNEQHENALRVIDQFAQKTPIWIKREPRAPGRPNPERAELDSLAAVGRAFADYLPEAQQRLEPMVATAPYSADLRTSLGTVYLWRGWPRQALSEIRIVSAQEPEHLGARLAEMDAQMSLREYRLAEDAFRSAQAIAPTSPQVRQAASSWGIHTAPELRVEVSRLASSGLNENVADYAIDAHLYSSPFYYRYRPYLHTSMSAAQFPEGLASYKRAGVGVEFKSRPLEANAELSVNSSDAGDPGITLGGRWHANDYWSIGAGWQSYADDVPLRARNLGVEGWSVDADTQYRFNETRSVGAAVHRVEMTDGNVRRAIGANGTQRIVTKPRYKLDATASIQTSRNFDVGATYFNPPSDLGVNLTLNNDWILWREYTRSFRHRLAGTGGTYKQRNYDTRLIWGAQYEHVWNWTQRFELMYGLTRTRHIYDGTAEYATKIYLAVDWRF